MSIVTKTIIGVVGAGGVAGSGVIAFRHLSKESKFTLSQKLQEEGFSPMKSDNVQWAATLSKYNEVKSSEDEVFEVSNTVLTEKQLKNKCENFLKRESYSETEKFKAMRWCTTPISIKDRINKLGRRPLNSTNGGSEDKNAWIDLVKKHLSNSSKNKLTVEITSLPERTDVDDDRINKLKEGCRSLEV